VRVRRPNPATTSWLFRAFGEAGLHGLLHSLAMGSTSFSQGKQAGAWCPSTMALRQSPRVVMGRHASHWRSHIGACVGSVTAGGPC
jgi:hypothetical protein